MDTTAIFSYNLKEILREKNVTQRELAKRLDITPQSVNDWCKGKSMPRMRKIDKICHCLNVTRSDLLENHYITKELDLLINKYNKLNNEGRGQLMDYADFLLSKYEYKKDTRKQAIS